ncbi:drug resistance transporter, EmrB/QacA subfamily [Blastococcus aggregatus]|uniref:Drug resistance transporter, EmrB/QacA subfamily n=1 Tax=Blastococcus aggregatus TaxID=38502 RepID=A0A285VKY8_9ACTN|nr:MFS transporter [Blastococcus aggregatus]SOC53251.1 drug resistance transporter, EmrB/QacA subfamily [Blastococcus aggregatus]
MSATTGPATAAPARSPGLVLLVVSAAVFLSSLDLFIVNIAFPVLGETFETSTGALSWVLNGYTIVFAALLAPAGRVADRIGRRRVFLAGLATFLAGSLGCAFAWGVGSLVAFRVVQSVGGAMVTATSLALLLHAFPPARRATAIAVWSMVGGVAAALGPPIGGLLLELSWRWIFLVNVPVGIAALVIGLRVLPESRDESETRRPDLLGAVLLVVSVGLLAYGLVDAPDRGWGSRVVVGAFAGAAVAGALVGLRAARVPRGVVPVLPLALFRVRSYTLANLAMAFFMAGFGGMLLGNVLWLTEGWGFSSIEAGFALIPGPALAALTAIPAGRLGARIGCGPVAAAGTAIFALGALFWILQVGPESGFVTDFLPGQVFTGIGVGLTLTNLSAAASSSLPPAALATGTATFGAFRQIGATLGVSILLAAVAGAGGELSGAERGWSLTVGLALVASLLALAVGRGHHADLQLPAPVAVPAPTPAPVD